MLNRKNNLTRLESMERDFSVGRRGKGVTPNRYEPQHHGGNGTVREPHCNDEDTYELSRRS